MKKILFAFILFGFPSAMFCQSFSDDFESYDIGAMLAATSADWETWTGPNGGTDDVEVISDNAHSGSKSVFFSSSATSGGPADIVMPFPGELEVGQFNLEMWLYVNPDAGAYFNLQETAIIGTTWAADIYFLAGGEAQFTSGGSLLLSASYPEDMWFKLRMENNLSTNTWEIFFDDISQGIYTNGSTQIASIDIFPLNGNQFFMDDFSYEYIDYAVPVLNGAIVSINNMNSALSSQSVTPELVIRNLGSTSITSFTVDLTYNGFSSSQDVSGVNIPSLGFYSLALQDNYFIAPGLHQAIATISSVNGLLTNDDDPLDDVKTLDINPIVPAAGKAVIAEEGTGTWCPWCVRGTVFMEKLSTDYAGFFIGIAVHNSDPMTVTEYDSGLGGLISGYPSGLVDRGPVYDPSQFEIPFLERIQIAPKALIVNGANWDSGSRILQVSTTTTFQETVSGNYKIALVLAEDDVTGTGSTWAQSNAYAGGSNGVMGGFEDLPNPVPANQMSYDHVARVISPSFEGFSSAFTGMMNSGNISTHNFSFTLPSEWDENSMHIIAMVIAPDGTIDNAASVNITEAVQNGFVNGTQVVGITSLSSTDEAFTIYPVPSRNECYMNIHLQNNSEFAIEIYNSEGKIMAAKDYGTISGELILPINTSEWPGGIYNVRIIRDGIAHIRRIIKE